MAQPSARRDENRSPEKRMAPAFPRPPARTLAAVRRRVLPAACLALAYAVLVMPQLCPCMPPSPTMVVSARLFMPDQSGNPAGSTDFQTFQQTQFALLKSRLVLNAVLRDPRVANLAVVRSSKDPLAWLEKELRVETAANVEIVRVSLSGENAEELKVIVDAVVKAYLVEVVDKETKHRRARLEELKRLCNLSEESLKRAQERLRVAAKEPALTEKLLEQQTATLWKNLGEVRTALRTLRWELNMFKMSTEQGEPIANRIDDYVNIDPVLLDYLKQQALQERDNVILRKRIADPQDKHIKEGEQKLAELKTKIEKRRQQLREAAISRAIALLECYEEREKTLLAEQKDLDRRMKDLVRAEGMAEEDRLFMEHEKKKWDLFASAWDKLAVELEGPPRVQLLERATVTKPARK